MPGQELLKTIFCPGGYDLCTKSSTADLTPQPQKFNAQAQALINKPLIRKNFFK